MRSRWIGRKSQLALVTLTALGSPSPAGAAEGAAAGADPQAAQLEEVLRQNEEMRRQLQALREQVERARDEARAARDEARAAKSAPVSQAAYGTTPGAAETGGLFSRRVGPATLQLLDISLDTLFAAGSSTATDAQLATLEGGGHDPRQRGFNLQQVELSFLGAVDPYFTGEAHLVYFLDTDGESQFEIEEAFATTQMLPFDLEEHGLQLEVGQFFTEFGRVNPMHPHAWDWQDQPVILTRLFGGDGMRGPGVRLGWLTPLPWFSEVHVGVQNANGETMVSFRANDEVFEERAIGGRPFDDVPVNGFDDLVYLVRWVNGFDVSDTLSAQLGGSFLVGPNATGGDAETWIAGADLVLKWRPLSTDRGWPFVTWQTEFAYRDYEASDFFGCIDAEAPCAAPAELDGKNLEDWGLYTQVLWGFRRGWAAGLRYEYASGSGSDVIFDEDLGIFLPLSRNDDPYRSTRHRVSPLLVFYPSEFSRLRLQYDYDHAADLRHESQHTVWAGLEFLFGAHAAHGY